MAWARHAVHTEGRPACPYSGWPARNLIRGGQAPRGRSLQQPPRTPTSSASCPSTVSHRPTRSFPFPQEAPRRPPSEFHTYTSTALIWNFSQTALPYIITGLIQAWPPPDRHKYRPYIKVLLSGITFLVTGRTLYFCEFRFRFIPLKHYVIDIRSSTIAWTVERACADCCM